MVNALESALNSPTGQAALLEISTTTKSGQMSKSFSADTPGTIQSTGIGTLDFSRKTTNAVLSGLQIVDVIKQFFKKLQIHSSRVLHF